MLTIRRLDISDARLLIAGASEKAREIGVPMCIAVTDESGQLIAFERMDGGKVTSTTIAIDKAFTAAAAKKATHEYGAASQPGNPTFGIHSAIGDRRSADGGRWRSAGYHRRRGGRRHRHQLRHAGAGSQLRGSRYCSLSRDSGLILQ